MPGEKILVVDDSAAVRSIARKALENKGFLVTTAGNAAAALLAPELNQFDVAVVDSDLEGIDGLRVSRELKTDAQTHRAMILLLVPEKPEDERASVDQGAADGYLRKPFSPESLALKVQALLEQKRVLDQCDAQLRAVTEKHIEEFASRHVQQAIERRSQIMTDTAVLSILSKVEERVKAESDQRGLALAAEKEQELIQKTVDAVAQAAVKEIAQTRVTEAMEAILRDGTEKAVKRAAERALPAMIRERVKETVDNSLPREITMRVQKATEQMAPEISENIVSMVTSVTEKVIPRVAREKLPDILDRQVDASASRAIPPLLEKLLPREVERRMAENVEPIVRKGVDRMRRQFQAISIILAVIFLALSVTVGVFACKLSHKASATNLPVPAAATR